jgi:serine/threonine protein kinase
MNEQTENYRASHPDEEPDENPRLVEALREYQAALDSGRRPSRKDFLARYSDIATELSECLHGLEFLNSAAPRLQSRDSAVPAAVPVGPDGILGDFHLMREIGKGGMGVVYEAIQMSLGRRVALKVLPFAATLDARQLQRFENEARAAAHLHHSNIVPVFAVGCDRGVHYYAMQLIDGRTLADVIDHLRQTESPTAPSAPFALPVSAPAPSGEGSKPRRAPDTVAGAGFASVTHQSLGSKSFYRTAASLGAQTADALEYAHQMGVVHRDIKPANLILDGRGVLWVTDFGLARIQAAPGVTAPGETVGTLRYMSPEQAEGRQVIDPRSDIYSLGVTLYELVTQEPAFPARERQECLRQILEGDPPPPRRLNRAVPPELETIILKAMSKHPEDRYDTANDLADDLRRFLDDQPVRARRPTLRERAAKWARRHRRLVTGAVLGLVAAVVVLAVTTWRVSLAEEKTKEANKELKAALVKVQEQKDRADEAREKEAVEHDRAESNYREARKVLDFLTRLGREELPNRPEFQAFRKKLLTELLTYYTEFIDQHADDREISEELIDTRLQVSQLLEDVGKKAEAMAFYERAMHDRFRIQAGGHQAPFPSFGGPKDAPRGGIPQVFLLSSPAVQTDLELTAAQVEKVTALVKAPRGERGGPPSDKTMAESEKALADVLEPQQSERLQQINRQLRGPQALLDPETATALDLTATQKEKIRSHLDKARSDMWSGRGPGGPKPPKGGGRKDVDWKQVNEQVLHELNADQLARWKEMLGEPFKGDTRGDRHGDPRGGPPPRGH